MANTTLDLRGSCPPPFFDLAQFGFDGCMYSIGNQLTDDADFVVTEGRFCAPIPLEPGLSCCLPCPASDYLYPEKFKGWYRAAEALNLVGLACMVFLLLTFVCLPAEKTRRHYLSYGLIVGAMFLSLAFVIPFASRPEQCFDEITPNDMFTNLTCAFSGAFLIAGGMSMAVWSKWMRGTWIYQPRLTSYQSSFGHCQCTCRFAGTTCPQKSSSMLLKFWAGLSPQHSSPRPLPSLASRSDSARFATSTQRTL